LQRADDRDALRELASVGNRLLESRDSGVDAGRDRGGDIRALRGGVGVGFEEELDRIEVGLSDVSNDLMARKCWIAGKRFIQDLTQGTLGGNPYFRVGMLGYSNMDRRYEWNTVDGINTNMMTYHGRATRTGPISMTGTYTDQGLLGEPAVRKPIPMRTVVEIVGPDRHVLKLYMTPPGAREMLASEQEYVRVPE